MKMMNEAAGEAPCSKDIEGEVAQVEVFLFVTILLLGILLLLGALRHRTSSGILSFLLFVIYTAVSQAIPYIMGLMKSAPFKHQLFPLWASMLLFAYGSADNMSLYSLDEAQSTAKFLWGFILQFVGLSLILFLKSSTAFLLPLIFLIPLMFIKVTERGLALSFAGKTPGLESVTMRLTDYMKTEHELTGVGQQLDPVNMKGYSYLVDVTDVKIKDHKIHKGITIQQIWECQGKLLSSNDGDPDCMLKDTCLSFALFWLLLRKFAGYPLHERKLEKTWNFVVNGLLSNEDDPTKAFRVIEVELNFLFDYFYTKYFFYYYSRYITKVFHIVLVLLFASLTTYNLRNYLSGENNVGIPYQNAVVDVDVVVTWIMIVAIVVLETLQLCVLVTSRWFKVTMICYYVKQRVWERKSKIERCIEILIEMICSIPSSGVFCKPWQRNISQYSLLRSYKCVRIDFVSRMLNMNLKIPISSISRKAQSVEFTPMLIKAVLHTLKANGPSLSNGITSLKRNALDTSLSWACEFEMKTDLILAWHVATTLCEFHTKGSSCTKAAETNFHVASTLSNYCAYLVAKAPKLLPDHAYNCKYIYNIVILDTKRLLKGCNSIKQVYEKLVVEDCMEEERNPGQVLKNGAMISKRLIHDIREGERMWQVLADFWAELILYLAPSDDEVAHAERLAEGGEFITHLWALLIHGGIVSRDDFMSDAASNTSQTVTVQGMQPVQQMHATRFGVTGVYQGAIHINLL